MSGGAIVQPQSKTSVPEEQIVRYNYQERFTHWINGISYGYCLLTGLALFTPYMYWLGTVLGGGGAIRYWHPRVRLVYFARILHKHRMLKRHQANPDARRHLDQNP